MSETISLSRIRELDLSAAASAGRPLHLSAASGLVRAGRFLHVVADDELHLGVFRSTDAKVVELTTDPAHDPPGSRFFMRIAAAHPHLPPRLGLARWGCGRIDFLFTSCGQNNLNGDE